MCPNGCSTALLLSERHGVEIDYCPSCRGVWLDRGELDKIIERAIAQEPLAPGEPPIPTSPNEVYRRVEVEHRQTRRFVKRGRGKNWLEELFDFD